MQRPFSQSNSGQQARAAMVRRMLVDNGLPANRSGVVDLLTDALTFARDQGHDPRDILETVEERIGKTAQPPANTAERFSVLWSIPECLRVDGDEPVWIWEGSASHKDEAIDRALNAVAEAYPEADLDDFDLFSVLPGVLEFL